MLVKLLCNMLSLQGEMLSLLKASREKTDRGQQQNRPVIWELLQGMALIS